MLCTVYSTRHNGRWHTPTGRHWHNLIPNACSHITYISVHVMVHSVTLARIDILPEDGPTVTETCRRFYEILAFWCVWICFRILSLQTKDTGASSWLFDFVSYFLARYKNENTFYIFSQQIHLIMFLDFFSPSSFIPPQNVVYFLMLSFLVHKIFTFYINGMLNCKCPSPGPKG